MMRDFYTAVSNRAITPAVYLLLGNHDLEAVKVGQAAASGTLDKLLGGAGGGPLAVDIGGSPELLDSGSAGTAGQLDDQLGQVDATDRHHLALEVKTIDDHLG